MLKLPYPCAFCGGLALDLRGQDAFLPAYATHGYAAQTIDKEAYGLAHMSCLIASGNASLWTALQVRLRTQLAGTEVLYWAEEVAVLWTERIRRISLISNGDEVRMTTGGLKKASRYDADSVMFPHRGIVSLNLEHSDLDMSAIQEELKSSGEFPLTQLIDGFGVSDTLLFPDALEDGSVTPLKDDPKVTWDHFRHNWLYANASYSYVVKLPESEVARLVGLRL